MIYIVEDDSNIRDLVLYTLNNSGFEARGFGRPSEFRAAIADMKPELILLDIMLPEEDGISILKDIRSDSAYDDVPVMMLTARGSEYDKVIGLDSGADDYMPKPFGMMELVARVKALLRRNRHADAGDDALKCGDIVMSPSRRTVTAGGREIDLTFKEFELLELLLENRGIVFTREQLLTRIWGYSFSGESRTVDVHIRTLRQKLGDSGDAVETVRGVGYRSRAAEK